MKQQPFMPILIFLIFIFGISISNGIKKDIDFSEFENRPLAQFPTFSFERLVDGTFTRQFETYMTDQFIGKTFWTGVKAKAEQAVLKQENNGVYFGKDDFLFDKPTALSKQFQKNLDTLKQFTDAYPNLPVTVLLAPTSIDIYEDKLPAFATPGMHTTIIKEIQRSGGDGWLLVDPLSTLQAHQTEEIYFRTDHHWTTMGAFYAYQELMSSFNEPAWRTDDFTIEQVSAQFFGTHYAKANDLWIPPDVIHTFKPLQPMKVQLQADNDFRIDGLYDSSFLTKRDQYAYFLGGNHARTIITSSVDNGKKLLLIKDSYAHAIAPFLANHFEEIHLLDLRYYRASISDYIERFQPTNVLILYNSPNFAADSSFLHIKY